MTVTDIDRKALEIACTHYIETICALGAGEIDAAAGGWARRELHYQILEITGLSSFEFGGLPFWFDVSRENTTILSRRLFNTLMECVRHRERKPHKKRGAS